MSTGRPGLGAKLLLAGLSTLLALAVGEGAVRLVGVQTADDPYLHFGRVAPFFERVEVGGGSHLRVRNYDLYRERGVMFPVAKERGTFRVFCVGGSASAGWPHPGSESYSAFLGNALRRADPDRPVEVINVSAHAYAAYRARLVFQQVIDLEPDLVVVYSGNNEFLEKRRYATRPRWWAPLSRLADRLVLYRLARGSAVGRLLFPEDTFGAKHREHETEGIWSKIERQSAELRSDPEQQRMVEQHYGASLRSMVEGARARGVPVVLLTVPVNLRDWRPNVSRQPLRGAELTRWQAVYGRGRTALLRGEAATALASLEEAARLNPQHADSTYFLARALEAGGRLDEAHDAYSRARDLDDNPFRALSSFQGIIRRIAAESDNVILADAEGAFRRASAPNDPGFELFLDYVHPTRRGNLVLAKLVYELLVERRLVGSQAAGGFDPRPPPGADTGYAEEADHELQATVLNLSMMMHQHPRALELARSLVATPGALERIEPARAQVVRTAVELLPRVIEAEHRELAGNPVSPEERAGLDRQLLEAYVAVWGQRGVLRSLKEEVKRLASFE